MRSKQQWPTINHETHRDRLRTCRSYDTHLSRYIGLYLYVRPCKVTQVMMQASGHLVHDIHRSSFHSYQQYQRSGLTECLHRRTCDRFWSFVFCWWHLLKSYTWMDGRGTMATTYFRDATNCCLDWTSVQYWVKRQDPVSLTMGLFLGMIHPVHSIDFTKFMTDIYGATVWLSVMRVFLL